MSKLHECAGNHQSVASFTFYGELDKRDEYGRNYYEGIQANAEHMQVSYLPTMVSTDQLQVSYSTVITCKG